MLLGFCQKLKINDKKTEFLAGSEGNRKESFIDISFFNFGISTGISIPKIEYNNDNFCRRNELKCCRLIWKIWIICMFSLVTGDSEDMPLDMRTYVDI